MFSSWSTATFPEAYRFSRMALETSTLHAYSNDRSEGNLIFLRSAARVVSSDVPRTREERNRHVLPHLLWRTPALGLGQPRSSAQYLSERLGVSRQSLTKYLGVA